MGRVKRKCKNCGEIKLVPKSLSKRPFCDRKCMSEWMNKQKGKNTNHWQGGKEIKSKIDY